MSGGVGGHAAGTAASESGSRGSHHCLLQGWLLTVWAIHAWASPLCMVGNHA